MSNQEADLVGKAVDIAKKAWLVGLGAGGTAYDKAAALVAEKVFGKKPPAEAGGASPSGSGSRLEQFEAKGGEVEAILKEKLGEAKVFIDGRIAWCRKNLNIDVINREQELAHINERLDELTRRVESLEKPK